MVVYDYYKEVKKRNKKSKVISLLVLLTIIITLSVAASIYLEVIQLNEIGGFSTVYIKNLTYKLIFSSISFLVVFSLITITHIFIKKNLNKYFNQNDIKPKRMLTHSIGLLISFLVALATKDFFYEKALVYFNSVKFGVKAPMFDLDVGYFIFERPFLMSCYEFVFSAWILVMFYTIFYYVIIVSSNIDLNNLKSLDFKILKVKGILRHNLVNLSVLFLIKAFSYTFQKEGIVYSTISIGEKIKANGASYVDVNIWLNYYRFAPILAFIVVILALILIWKGMFKKAVITISIFPAVFILISIVAVAVQNFVVGPNQPVYETKYIKNNMEQTREAYGFNKIKTFDIPKVEVLTKDTIKDNIDTVDNVRVIDYQSTLDTNKQLQSNRSFYTFKEGDIISYNQNGKEAPVLITAREINKDELPEKSYVNSMFRYTHGYGVVINPINKIKDDGQVDFILGGLKDSKDKIKTPQIYFGELTYDNVIVNAENNLNEVDYDGIESRYNGNGGIPLTFLNRVLFSLKYADYNMLISSYISNQSKLLLNREIMTRVGKALPFLSYDKDPYIIIDNEGGLKWIIDGYTTTSLYPYSQNITKDINYIRNSVKVVVDAYDGDIKCYIVDKRDPIIQVYKNIYKDTMTEEPLPEDVASYMKYPETLFKFQTEILKKYHLKEDKSMAFMDGRDQWEIAQRNNEETVKAEDIEPFYNMIKLPSNIGSKEELILMRPFTPSGGNKHNMVSWLSVRNSAENYGEMILFNYDSSINIFGPYQVTVKINQNRQISKEMTLLGQNGSQVYKGNLLVIPIGESVLYVEPIYIKATVGGGAATPEVAMVVVGYQKGDEFKYGYGTNLKKALNNLFNEKIFVVEEEGGALDKLGTTKDDINNDKLKEINNNNDDKNKIKKSDEVTNTNTDVNAEKSTDPNAETVKEIINKYDDMKSQMDELGKLIEKLKE